MWCRYSTAVASALLLGGALGANEATGQNYYWHRDYQVMRSLAQARAFAQAGPNVDDPGQSVGDSGFVLGDTAESNAESNASASVQADPEQGIPEGGSASAHAETADISSLNPNDQAIMQWSFIHNQAVAASAEGDATAWAQAWQGSFADARAVLSSTGSGDPTVGRLRLDYGWGGFPGQRSAPVFVSFGNAWIVVFKAVGEQLPPATAWGWDGWGNYFEKQGADPSVTNTGTFSISLPEFTAPLQVGQRARIWTIAGWANQQDGYTWDFTAVGPVSNITSTGSDLFAGTVEVWVDTP